MRIKRSERPDFDLVEGRRYDKAQRLDAVADYVRARQAADQAEELRRKAEAALLDVLEEQELKSTAAVIDGVKYTTTVTSRTTTTFDEKGLAKALGAQVYRRLTIPTLDRDKLKTAIDEGDIDAGIVAQHTTITNGARTVRLTRKAADEHEAEEA